MLQTSIQLNDIFAVHRLFCCFMTCHVLMIFFSTRKVNSIKGIGVRAKVVSKKIFCWKVNAVWKIFCSAAKAPVNILFLIACLTSQKILERLYIGKMLKILSNTLIARWWAAFLILVMWAGIGRRGCKLRVGPMFLVSFLNVQFQSFKRGPSPVKIKLKKDFFCGTRVNTCGGG